MTVAHTLSQFRTKGLDVLLRFFQLYKESVIIMCQVTGGAPASSNADMRDVRTPQEVSGAICSFPNIITYDKSFSTGGTQCAIRYTYMHISSGCLPTSYLHRQLFSPQGHLTCSPQASPLHSHSQSTTLLKEGLSSVRSNSYIYHPLCPPSTVPAAMNGLFQAYQKANSTPMNRFHTTT